MSKDIKLYQKKTRVELTIWEAADRDAVMRAATAMNESHHYHEMPDTLNSTYRRNISAKKSESLFDRRRARSPRSPSRSQHRGHRWDLLRVDASVRATGRVALLGAATTIAIAHLEEDASR